MLSYYLSLLETEEERSKFETVYEEHRQLMKYIANKILRNESVAEEAVHDAFVKLTAHLDGVEDVNSHKTRAFVVTIVKNVAIDIARKESKLQTVSLDDEEYRLSSYENVSDNIAVEEIYQKIRSLPESYQEILMLKINQDLSDKELADVLGISYVAARKRLQRAREALAKLLGR